MKPLQQILSLFFVKLFFLSIPAPAGALYLSWSGYGRLEAFYQDEKNHYANVFFALKPELHIRDSLSFKSRFDFLGLESSSPWDMLLRHSGRLHQRGYVFFYKDFQNSSNSSFPFLVPSQFYLDYKSEFFKARLGRAPYHFGLGASYSAVKSPFNLWMSVPDQLSVFMIYENFYLQPSLFYHHLDNDKKTASALLEGGVEQEQWKLALLYEHKFESSARSFAELYGEYEEVNWGLKSSLSYLFQSENSFALALEGLYKQRGKIPLDWQLKAGALNNEAQFHPQYQASFLLQNRWMREGLSVGEDWQIASAQVQKFMYFSPSVSLSFYEESLKLEPLFLLAHSFEKDQFSYELNFSGKYHPKESLFFNLQTGVLYQKEWIFALLAQAAVSF